MLAPSVPPLLCAVHENARAANLFACIDLTVRSYRIQGSQLTPQQTLPKFPGGPWNIQFDPNRTALFVRDNDKEELNVSVMEAAATGKWSEWHSLAHNTTDKLDIQCMCLTTANHITLFDLKSSSLMEFEFA